MKYLYLFLALLHMVILFSIIINENRIEQLHIASGMAWIALYEITDLKEQLKNKREIS